MPGITDIIKLKLLVDDQEVTIEDESHWQEWRAYVDDTFAWITSQPKRPSHPQTDKSQPHLPPEAEEESLSQEAEELPNGVLDLPQTQSEGVQRTRAASFSQKRPPLGERAIDHLVRVLAKSGGSSTKDRAYKMMVTDGYITDSTEPLRNLHDKVRRKYYKLVSVAGDAFTLTKEGEQLAHRLLATSQVSATQSVTGFPSGLHVEESSDLKSGQSSDDAKWNESIDFILRAGHKLGGDATFDDLIAPMLAEGWNTRSDTSIKRRHTISAIINHHRELVSKPGPGRMRITPKGYDRLRAMGITLGTEANNQENDSPR